MRETAHFTVLPDQDPIECKVQTLSSAEALSWIVVHYNVQCTVSPSKFLGHHHHNIPYFVTLCLLETPSLVAMVALPVPEHRVEEVPLFLESMECSHGGKVTTSILLFQKRDTSGCGGQQSTPGGLVGTHAS